MHCFHLSSSWQWTPSRNGRYLREPTHPKPVLEGLGEAEIEFIPQVLVAAYGESPTEDDAEVHSIIRSAGCEVRLGVLQQNSNICTKYAEL